MKKISEIKLKCVICKEFKKDETSIIICYDCSNNRIVIGRADLEKIEMDLIRISGGLSGLAVGERNRTVKDLLNEKSNELLEIHGKLVSLRKGE